MTLPVPIKPVDEDTTLHADVAALLAEFDLGHDDEEAPTESTPPEDNRALDPRTYGQVYVAPFLRAFSEVLVEFEGAFSDEIAQAPKPHRLERRARLHGGVQALRAVLDPTLLRTAQANQGE